MLDEDFDGEQKLVVAASVQGTSSENVPMSVMAKNRWAMHFQHSTDTQHMDAWKPTHIQTQSVATAGLRPKCAP